MLGKHRAYTAAVGAIGFTLLALLAVTVDLDRLRADWSLVATLGAFLVVGHFFSIPLSIDPRGAKVQINSPFAFALALYGGIGAAALLYASTFVLDGSLRHRSFRKLAFNVGTHTIGLAAGGGVWMALSGGRPASTGTLPAILTGTAVFVLGKSLLFAVKVRLDETTPPDVTPARLVPVAVGITVMAQAVVLLIVLTANQIPVLLLALGLPTVAVYLMLRSEARANIGRSQAEQSARREAELRVQEHELRLQQQEVTRKLQETDQLKDDLLAMVSHELRNPLSTVLGVLRLLSTGAQLSAEERQEMLEMADRQAWRLRSLIEQLLLAARFERGEADYPSSGSELVEADAAELVLQAATEARAGHRDHPIRVECDGTLPVRVAPDAVLQILGNLLDNACKYSPDERLVRLLAERHGAHAVLAVEDDGGGIPVAERERIFERFTQLAERRSGLGLGLYIARQLARAQGGDLVLTDAHHAGGARFELRLPLRQRANGPLPSVDDGLPSVHDGLPATDGLPSGTDGSPVVRKVGQRY
jgi:signal transduction histidine kinase